jgi:hypothetical protein
MTIKNIIYIPINPRILNSLFLIPIFVLKILLTIFVPLIFIYLEKNARKSYTEESLRHVIGRNLPYIVIVLLDIALLGVVVINSVNLFIVFLLNLMELEEP